MAGKNEPASIAADADAVDFMPTRGSDPDKNGDAVDRVLAHATLEEKVGMMSGHGFFAALGEDDRVWGARPYRAGGGIDRLGIPPLLFTDGPRGVTRVGSTCFPCTMARGATFDADLEHRIGQAMGKEARAQGCSFSGAVCINLLRHPAWGRAQETYGEDPWHLGVMGAAMGTGIQAHNVIATVKHFALNSMENARFKVDVRADERSLHEVYLPHFKHCLDAGIASVMTAYNKVNGEYCGQNPFLLTQILREEWGFDGFVHSDWVRGVYKVDGAAAGLDIENPEPQIFGEKLVEAVRSGAIEESVVDRACRRILATQFRFAARPDPLPGYPSDLIANEEHRALALEAAEKCAVLLENDGTLPLSRTNIRRLAVLGRLAAIENTGDNGSSRVRPPYVVTPLAGLRDFLGIDAVVHGDEDDIEAAAATARSADAVLVVVGYTAKEEGEYIIGDIALGADRKPGDPAPRPSISDVPIGGDRVSLDLPPVQIDLIHAAKASGKPVIVVIVAGSAVMVERWREGVGAILMSFYAGMEGGTALARLLFGEVSPSGKLPFTVARDTDDYPFFDRDADTIDYGYWHGYSKFDRERLTPRYAFGDGLSYTRFSYHGLTARRGTDAIEVEVSVRNDGKWPADAVVQCYVCAPGVDAERPIKLLRAFDRVHLRPSQSAQVQFSVPLDSLRWRDDIAHRWRLERGTYRFGVGGSSNELVYTSLEV
ncbi:beta-glucosidase [Sphingomonas gellani]|uniref:Beta-glucosidase n=1 Tax=Sphingomonas gellani TaxID=1166340 RepID=A0A1H8IHL0_9SPHN|nr:glycoside hydrolase family 3 C-terminal domain-containing protein [Sphingomonas gellani]SEN67759.1 beta-glucosidase [Sphingomonas gellani]